MGQLQFKLPDVGEGIAEAEIVAWHVRPGEEVREDDPFVDVMTDKATVEISSPASGRVVSLKGEVGALAAVGSVIAVLDIDGSDHVEPKPDDEAPAEPSPAEAGMEPAPPSVPATSSAPTGHPLASPAVRQRARELGLDLQRIRGSGPEGRITHADLEDQVSAVAGPSLRQRDAVEVIKVVGLRRAIATRVADAKRRIPHFGYVEEIDVTELERLRARLNDAHPERIRLSLLPFIARALVQVLPNYPQVNAHFADEAGEVHRHAAVHLGIATQTPAGLMVPVVRHAEALDLWRIAEEIRRLAEEARAGKAPREDLMGSTITVTSLGALGGVSTTPVINAPEVAIIGPNRIIERPVVVGGQVAIRKMMNLSSSFDHRVVDGWDAAQFIQALKSALETPGLLFV